MKNSLGLRGIIRFKEMSPSNRGTSTENLSAIDPVKEDNQTHHVVSSAENKTFIITG